MFRFLTLLLIVLPWPLSAMAQVMPSALISVMERPDPDFDPLGIPAGAFLLHPSLQIREQYNDNIFAAASNEQSDLITNIRPALVAQSNWDLHMLRFFTGADIAAYADNTDENFEDIRIGASARYDITYGTSLDAEIRYDRAHEDRSSPDDAGSQEPTGIDITTARLGFARDLAKFKLFTNIGLRDIKFENAVSNAGIIDNSFRNRTQKELDVKIAYEYLPNCEVFIRGVYDRRDYERTSFPDRSSDGYRLTAGTEIDISGKVKGEIHGGYIKQDYSGNFEDVSAADYGGSLLWNPNGLTSLRAGLDRKVIETTGALASGYIRTAMTAQIEHAFADNLLALFNLTYDDDDFVGITRDDKTFGAGAEIEYKPIRGLETSLRYDYRERDSSLPIEDFTNHQLTLRAGYTF